MCQQLIRISVAHRLAKKTNATTTNSNYQQKSAVIVRFSSRGVRDAVYAARKSLKDHQPAVYINEDLTEKNQKLFKLSREAVRNHKFISTWTFRVHVEYI